MAKVEVGQTWEQDGQQYKVIRVGHDLAQLREWVAALAVSPVGDGATIRFVRPNEPKAPTPRPGQRWSDGRYEYALVDEQPAESDDYPPTYLARRDDGLRVTIDGYTLEGATEEAKCWRYVSGPSEPETEREALERVVKLEAEYPAAGETAGTWLRKLIATAETLHFKSGQRYTGDAEAVRACARKMRGNVGAWNAVRWEGAMINMPDLPRLLSPLGACEVLPYQRELVAEWWERRHNGVCLARYYSERERDEVKTKSPLGPGTSIVHVRRYRIRRAKR